MPKIIMAAMRILISKTATWIITFHKKYAMPLWKIYTILSICGTAQLEAGSLDKE